MTVKRLPFAPMPLKPVCESEYPMAMSVGATPNCSHRICVTMVSELVPMKGVCSWQ